MLLGQAGKIPTTGSNFPFKDLKRTFKDLKLAFKDLKLAFKVFERKISPGAEEIIRPEGRKKKAAGPKHILHRKRHENGRVKCNNQPHFDAEVEI